MNCRQREALTLSFTNEGLDRGVVEESMEPWDQTVANWKEQGLDTGFLDEVHAAVLPTDNLYHYNRRYEPYEYYYNSMMTEAVYRHEMSFAFDPVKRICIRVPFISHPKEILEDCAEYTIRRDHDGWIRKYPKGPGLVQNIQPVVTDEESWERLKAHIDEQRRLHLSKEHMEKSFGRYREGCKNGDFVIRLRLSGFFWFPRDLLGVEDHLVAYYDYPEMLQDIGDYVLEFYKEQLSWLFEILTPSLIFFEEDLSGRNGPMISPALFDEFVGSKYRQLIPFIKEHGVDNVFMDTDGDFTPLIPNIMAAGLDGMLPVDVNAGVDIVKVREQYPTLKFFGGFNKLEIVKGKEAIEAEIARLEPVIRQGGCIICTDHQAAPHTPLENYRYYVQRLHEVMMQWRGEGARA